MAEEIGEKQSVITFFFFFFFKAYARLQLGKKRSRCDAIRKENIAWRLVCRVRVFVGSFARQLHRVVCCKTLVVKFKKERKMKEKDLQYNVSEFQSTTPTNYLIKM